MMKMLWCVWIVFLILKILSVVTFSWWWIIGTGAFLVALICVMIILSIFYPVIAVWLLTQNQEALKKKANKANKANKEQDR